jgi:hypothetical protein
MRAMRRNSVGSYAMPKQAATSTMVNNEESQDQKPKTIDKIWSKTSGVVKSPDWYAAVIN